MMTAKRKTAGLTKMWNRKLSCHTIVTHISCPLPTLMLSINSPSESTDGLSTNKATTDLDNVPSSRQNAQGGKKKKKRPRDSDQAVGIDSTQGKKKKRKHRDNDQERKKGKGKAPASPTDAEIEASSHASAA